MPDVLLEAPIAATPERVYAAITASAEGSFANVAFNWAYYPNSLKDYLETGAGRPGGLHR